VVTEFQINSLQNICCASIILILISLQFICKCFGNDLQFTSSLAQAAQGSESGSGCVLDVVGFWIQSSVWNWICPCSVHLHCKPVVAGLGNRLQMEVTRDAEEDRVSLSACINSQLKFSGLLRAGASPVSAAGFFCASSRTCHVLHFQIWDVFLFSSLLDC